MEFISAFTNEHDIYDDSKELEQTITSHIESEITVEVAASSFDDSLLVNTDFIAALFALHTDDIEDIIKFRKAMSAFDISQLAKLLAKNEDDDFYNEILSKYRRFVVMEKSEVQEMVRRSKDSQAVPNLRAVQNDIISTGHKVACVTDRGTVMFLSDTVGQVIQMQIEDPTVFTDAKKTVNVFDLRNIEKRLEIVVKIGPGSTKAVMSSVVGWFLMGRSYDVKKVDYKKFSKKLQPGTLSPLQATPKDFVANKCARIVSKAFDSALIVLDEPEVYQPTFYPPIEEQKPVCIYASENVDHPSHVSRNPSFHSDLSEWSWSNYHDEIAEDISNIDTHTLTPAKQRDQIYAIKSQVAETIKIEEPDIQTDLTVGGVAFPPRLQKVYGHKLGLWLHSRSYSNEDDLAENPQRIHIIKYTLASIATKYGFSCAVIDPISFCMIAIPSFLRRLMAEKAKSLGHELGGLIDTSLVPAVSTVIQMIAIHYRLSLIDKSEELQTMEEIVFMLNDDSFARRVEAVLDLKLDSELIDNILWYVGMLRAEMDLGYTILSGTYTKEGKARLAQLKTKDKVKSAKDYFDDDDFSPDDIASTNDVLSYFASASAKNSQDQGIS